MQALIAAAVEQSSGIAPELVGLLGVLCTGLATVIVAVVKRTEWRSAREREEIARKLAKAEQAQVDRLDRIETMVTTNGSNKTLGELTELLYGDLQQTKRELAAHMRRTDAHGRGAGKGVYE